MLVLAPLLSLDMSCQELEPARPGQKVITCHWTCWNSRVSRPKLPQRSLRSLYDLTIYRFCWPWKARSNLFNIGLNPFKTVSQLFCRRNLRTLHATRMHWLIDLFPKCFPSMNVQPSSNTCFELALPMLLQHWYNDWHHFNFSSNI